MGINFFISPQFKDAGTGEPPKMYSWDEATTSWVEQGA